MKKVLLKWKKEIKKGNTRKYGEIRPKPIFKKLRKVILRYLYLFRKAFMLGITMKIDISARLTP